MKKSSNIGFYGVNPTQTLEIIRDNEDLQAVALAVGQNVDLMEKQIREFHPQIAECGVRKRRLTFGRESFRSPVKIVCGMDGLLENRVFPRKATLSLRRWSA